MIEFDPATGELVNIIGPIGSWSSVWGVAGWSNYFFAFDASGAIIKLDIFTGDTELLEQTNIAWWGAGVRTLHSLPIP